MKVKKYGRLTHKESLKIKPFLNEKKSRLYIAKTLKRVGPIIAIEVNNCAQAKANLYNADLAYCCVKETYLNKRNLGKISTYFHSLRFRLYWCNI